MTLRKPLVDALRSNGDPVKEAEQSFVYGEDKAKAPAGTPTPNYRSPQPVSRVPFTTRIRADVAHALKRASLERQLEGVAPFMLQEILESVLEPWLRDNGYLS